MLLLILLLIAAHTSAQTWGQMVVSGGMFYGSGYFDGVNKTLVYNYDGYVKIHPRTDRRYSDPRWSGELYSIMKVSENSAVMLGAAVYAIPQFRQQERDWWRTWAKGPLKRKPVWAYLAEVAFLSGARYAGHTTSYRWVYGAR